MLSIKSNKCPLCESRLHSVRFACPDCKAEYPVDTELSKYDYLSEEQSIFLDTFLKCSGNISAVGESLGISYPTVKKRYEELLFALGLNIKTEKSNEVIDMSNYKDIDISSGKASDIVRKKLSECAGHAVINLLQGERCEIFASPDGKSFTSDKLPGQTVEYSVYDIIVDFLKENGKKARKGNGRNYKVGYGGCSDGTVMYEIACKYYGHKDGDSTFDPLFVLAAVLEWAGIAENGWGYISLKH